MKSFLLGSKTVASTSVPYIETDGTASYIDLGFMPTSDTTYSIDFSVLPRESGIAGIVMGALYGSRSNRFFIGNAGGPGLMATRPSLDAARLGISASGERHVVSYDGSMFSVDGVLFEPDAGPGEATTNILIGFREGSGVNGYSNSRIYSAKFWEGGVLIRDLVPYSGPRGIGLLDTVNDVLYQNASTTGTLTYGEEQE